MPAEAGASSAVAAQLLEADLVLIEPGSKGVVSKSDPRERAPPQTPTNWTERVDGSSDQSPAGILR